MVCFVKGSDQWTSNCSNALQQAVVEDLESLNAVTGATRTSMGLELCKNDTSISPVSSFII